MGRGVFVPVATAATIGLGFLSLSMIVRDPAKARLFFAEAGMLAASANRVLNRPESSVAAPSPSPAAPTPQAIAPTPSPSTPKPVAQPLVSPSPAIANAEHPLVLKDWKIQSEAALKDYERLINEGAFDKAWALLHADFKAQKNVERSDLDWWRYKTLVIMEPSQVSEDPKTKIATIKTRWVITHGDKVVRNEPIVVQLKKNGENWQISSIDNS